MWFLENIDFFSKILILIFLLIFFKLGLSGLPNPQNRCAMNAPMSCIRSSPWPPSGASTWRAPHGKKPSPLLLCPANASRARGVHCFTVSASTGRARAPSQAEVPARQLGFDVTFTSLPDTHCKPFITLRMAKRMPHGHHNIARVFSLSRPTLPATLARQRPREAPRRQDQNLQESK